MSNDGDPIILVDENDVETGIAEKIPAHHQGLRHRAISVLVKNGAGEMLIHRRAAGKYHSGELWTNACCSHPRPGEDTLAAATRRLDEEMGVRCTLAPLFKTHYRAAVSNGCIEDEIVHAFGGTYDGVVAPDPAEASDWRWVTLGDLLADRAENPDRYTVWFHHYLDRHRDEIAAWMRR